MKEKLSRRSLLGTSLGVTSGLLAGVSLEHRALVAQLVDRSQYGKQEPPVQGLQKGRLAGREVSRLIVGGNLISGSAHAGELIYQSALMTHYFTTEKIHETWSIAERNGINTTLMRADPHIVETYQAYRERKGGKLQWIAQTAPEQGDPVQNAKMAGENGAFAVYLHGGVSDKAVEAGKVSELAGFVEGTKKAGIVAGIGGHKIETIQAAEKAGLDPDFYMLTINAVQYYSSDPDVISSYMSSIRQPWIAFKVLGAGRAKPEDGFLHAFSRGADFVAVGMFDWQVRDDAALVQKLLSNSLGRTRDWNA